MAMGVLFGVFAFLLLIGTPAAALAVSTLASALVLGLPEIALVQQMTSNLSSVSLLAIPLFIFTGELMLRGGISERIIALAASLSLAACAAGWGRSALSRRPCSAAFRVRRSRTFRRWAGVPR